MSGPEAARVLRFLDDLWLAGDFAIDRLDELDELRALLRRRLEATLAGLS